jgi:hypothetical protein
MARRLMFREGTSPGEAQSIRSPASRSTCRARVRLRVCIPCTHATVPEFAEGEMSFALNRPNEKIRQL